MAIIPTYIVVMMITEFTDYFVLKNVITQTDILLIPVKLLGLQSIFMRGDISHWWFISTLMVLYIFFPFFSWLTEKSIYVRKDFIIIIGLTLASFYIYYTAKDILDFTIYYSNPFYRIPEFCAGIVSANISKKIQYGVIKWWYCIIGIMLFFLVCIPLFPFFLQEYNLYNLVIIPFFSFFLVSCINVKRGVLQIIGESKIVTFLSSLCLEIYICQAVIIMLLNGDIIVVSNKQVSFPVMTVLLAVVINMLVVKFIKKLSRS